MQLTRLSPERFVMSISVEDRSQFIAFTHELAAVAGPPALKHFRSGGSVDNKSGELAIDPVTAGDREAEAAMRSLIEARYPDHGIIGEEYGDKDPDAAFVWVLDPIDGTRGFVLGLPTWGTLIGLLHNGSPIVGAMAQPFVGDFFVGDGQSAYLIRGDDKKRLRVSPCPDFAKASIATTSASLFDDVERARYDRIENQCGLIRYGTDCYAYALLAAGFIDLVIESGLKPFDIVALIPIIEGAGGTVSNWSGEGAAGGGQILACGDKSLYEKALEILRA